MSSIVVSGDTSGAITIAAPAVSGTNTLTLPASTGTVALTSQLPVSGPTFSVYSNVSQSLASGTYTKVQFNQKDWDTATCFDTTNYRFTPNVAGYYQINSAVATTTGQTGETAVRITKNGTISKIGQDIGGVTVYAAIVSTIVYLNGSTDYVEAYLYQSSGSAKTLYTGADQTYFNGCYLRGA